LVSAWLHPRPPAWEQPVTRGTLDWAAARALDGALWVDARSAEDFARAHVPNALSLPANDWHTHIEALLMAWQPDQPLVVYCGGGACQASQEVAQRLRDELGLTNVWVLAGGWTG